MLDKYNREINYLRVSVTDRCNLRCYYCMPEGIQLSKRQNILSFEQIIQFIKDATKFGVKKVRFTGGEPLIRKNIETLIAAAGRIPKIEDLSLTTNGIHLSSMAQKLKEKGLHRVNISLDTLNKEKYAKITGGGDVNRVISGIYAAIKAKLFPVKINMVINKYTTDEDINELKAFVKELDLSIRFIKEMDLYRGSFTEVIGGQGGICSQCNRLRLSSSGKVKPCLFNDLAFDIKKMGNKEAILQAINNKPLSGSICSNLSFNEIGG